MTACGGSKSPADVEKSGVVFEPAASESLASEDAALAHAAALNSASLEVAEKRALALDGRATPTKLDQLQPGQPAPKSAYASGDIARKALAVGITAYRFYNGATGAHFYTVSATERDNVRNTLSPPFTYEGEAFRVASLYAPGLSPVHRFYNTQNGVHFYTISETERAYVVANLPHYTYEGVAYHASEVAGANLIPFYRFYVPSKGFHFYTASEAEKDQIIANLGETYRYEGIGYYVLDVLWNAEKLPHTGVPSTFCYRAGSDVLQDCSSSGTEELNRLQDGFLTFLGLGRLSYGPVSRPGGGTFGLNECVLDKATGLMWEGKNEGVNEPRYRNALFTNLGNAAANDVSAHLATVNASRLCGFDYWRVPSRIELQGILHYGNPQAQAAIDTHFEPAYAGDHWVRETDSFDSTQAWVLDFDALGGTSTTAARNESKAVRLVRGMPLGGTAARFTYATFPYGSDAANNVVNDSWTGLQWRRCEEGRVWNGATCTGALTKVSHEAALVHAKQHPGWRIPNVKELASLTDLTVVAGPRMNPVAFAGADPNHFWATTPYWQGSAYAWSVHTGTGAVSINQRSGLYGMRLLRANYSFTD